uniref:Sushi domain-containing protein n=1 Tax=Vombatus ursinus TaxID=29139 RepID=A0A4X2L2F3_VOMUR
MLPTPPDTSMSKGWGCLPVPPRPHRLSPRAQRDAGVLGPRPTPSAGGPEPGPKTSLCIPHCGAPHGASRPGAIMSRGPRSAPPALGLLCLAPSLLLLLLLLLPLARGNCDVPEKLPFALMSGDSAGRESFPEGYSVTYTCRPGYQRNRNFQPTRTCLADGTWSKATNFCEKKRCPNIGELANGHVNIEEDIVFGSTITFSCDKGFLLVGERESLCQIVGENRVGWSEPLPHCQIILCHPPPTIDNGRYTGDFKDYFNYGQSVTYTCNEPHTLIGEKSIHCTTENMRDGVWSALPPQCKDIKIPTVRTITNITTTITITIKSSSTSEKENQLDTIILVITLIIFSQI